MKLIEKIFKKRDLFDKEKYAVFVCEGIGIARLHLALMKNFNEQKSLPKKLAILYFDETGEFSHKKQFEELEKKSSLIHVFFIKEKSKLLDSIEKIAKGYVNECEYFISASENLNKEILDIVDKFNITKQNIKLKIDY